MTPKVQAAMFSGGRQVNVWLPALPKKYILGGAYGSSRKKVIFTIVRVQAGPTSVGGHRLTVPAVAPQCVISLPAQLE